MTNAILRGKPYAGNPHVRFDEGEAASATPRRGSLLCKVQLFGRKVLLAGAVFAAGVASGDVSWTGDDSDWHWWFENVNDYWGGTAPSSTDTVNLGKASQVGATARVYLKEGDAVSINKLNIANSNGQFSHLRVGPGATLTVAGDVRLPKQAAQNATGIVEVAGGTYVGNGNLAGAGHTSSIGELWINNGGSVTTASLTFGWLGPAAMVFDDGKFSIVGTWIIGGQGKPGTISGRKADIRTKSVFLGSNTSGARGDIRLADSSVFIDGVLNVGRASGNSIILTNSVLGMAAYNSARIGTKSETNDSVTNVLELIGSGAVFSNAYSVEFYQNTRVTVRGGKFLIDANAPDRNQFPFTVSAKSDESSADALQLYEVYDGLFAVTNRKAGQISTIDLASAGRALFRQFGGRVTAGGLYFNGTGGIEPRYELFGGTLDIDQSYNNGIGVRCATAEGRRPARFLWSADPRF